MRAVCALLSLDVVDQIAQGQVDVNEIDTRQVNLALTRDGEAFADAVRSVIEKLNRAVTRKIRQTDLAVADAVLRAVLADDHTQRLAEFLGPPTPSPR